MRAWSKAPGRTAAGDGIDASDNEATRSCRFRRALYACVAVLAVSGCSALPESLDPVSWLRAADDAVTADQSEEDRTLAARAASERAEPIPGADRPFPRLGEVPGAPPPVADIERRRQLADSLAAERANARYSEQTIAAARAADGSAPSAPMPPQSAPPPPPYEAQSEAYESTYQDAFARSAETAMAPPESGRVASTGRVHVAVIYFGSGSSKLSGSDKDVLRQVVQLYRNHGGQLRVVGHASGPTGKADIAEQKILNYRMSEDRAQAVAQELMRLGVRPEQVIVNAVSDTQRIYAEDTPVGEAANRRADIYIDGPQRPI